jgi:hypothetical protein
MSLTVLTATSIMIVETMAADVMHLHPAGKGQDFNKFASGLDLKRWPYSIFYGNLVGLLLLHDGFINFSPHHERDICSCRTADKVADGGALRADVLRGEPAAPVPQEPESRGGGGRGQLVQRGERGGRGEEALEELEDEDPAVAHIRLLWALRGHVHEPGEVSLVELAPLAASPLLLKIVLDPTEYVGLLLAK